LVNFFFTKVCVCAVKENIAVYFFLASQGLNGGYSGRRIRI